MEIQVKNGHKILPQADDHDSGHQKEVQPRSLVFTKVIAHSQLLVIHPILHSLRWQTQRHKSSVLSMTAHNQSVTQSPDPMLQVLGEHSVKPEIIIIKMKGAQRSL